MIGGIVPVLFLELQEGEMVVFGLCGGIFLKD